MLQKRGKITGTVFLICIILLTFQTSAQENDERVINIGGDTNSDGKIDVTDAVSQLSWLFQGGKEPYCKRCIDNNGDQRVDMADAIYLLNFLFLGGPEPVYGEVSDGVKDIVAPEAGDIAFENFKVPENLKLDGRIFCSRREELGINKIIDDDLNCGVPVYATGWDRINQDMQVSIYVGCVEKPDGNPDSLEVKRKRIFYLDDLLCHDPGVDLTILPSSEKLSRFFSHPEQIRTGFGFDVYVGVTYFIKSDVEVYVEGHSLKENYYPDIEQLFNHIVIENIDHALIFGGNIWNKIEFKPGDLSNNYEVVVLGGKRGDRIYLANAKNYGGYALLDGRGGNDLIDASSTKWNKLIILGGDGDDALEGGIGNDIILQEKSSENGPKNRIIGRWGDDILIGSIREDIIYGDSNNIVSREEYGNDFIIGDSPIEIDLEEILSRHQTYYDYSDSLKRYDLPMVYKDIKNKIAESLEYKTIISGKVPESKDGEDDEIYAGCGNDIVFAGEGNDKVSGSGLINPPPFDKGTDIKNIICDPEKDKDILLGGSGDDELHGMEGIDIVYGGSGNDNLFGDSEFPLKDGKYPVIGQVNYPDLVCGGKGKDEITANTADIDPDTSKQTINFLISGPRGEKSEEDLETVCLNKISGNEKRVCDDLANRRFKNAEKTYYILNGHVTQDNDPSKNPPWDYNSFDPDDPAWPNDERYCRDNWHDLLPGDKCMGSSLITSWGPLKTRSLLNIFPINIQEDGIYDMMLPDCGLYGPSDPLLENMRWGDISECNAIESQCCVCKENCNRDSAPRCTDKGFNCQQIGNDETPLDQIERGEIENWIEGDLHQCNLLVWKKKLA